MVKFAGISFRGLTLDDVFLEREGLTHITTVNAAYIVTFNEDMRFRSIVNDSIATFDGQAPYLVAKLLKNGARFTKISGSDLIYRICERAAHRGERVFLLGGMPASNARSLEILQMQNPNLMIAGFSPPLEPYPFSKKQNRAILQRIREFKPHYLLVGFGARKQLYWIDDHREALTDAGVRLAVGVGGAFEMVSGRLKRAPHCLQLLGLEGIYRFLRQPERFRLERLIKSARFLRYI